MLEEDFLHNFSRPIESKSTFTEDTNQNKLFCQNNKQFRNFITISFVLFAMITHKNETRKHIKN